MKFEFHDGEESVGIIMIPETPNEVASLLRMQKNLKVEAPSITLNFYNSPYMDIWMNKVHKSKRKSYATIKDR